MAAGTGVAQAQYESPSTSEPSTMPTSQPHEVCRRVKVRNPAADNYTAGATSGQVGSQYGRSNTYATSGAATGATGAYAGGTTGAGYQSSNSTYIYEQKCYTQP